MSLALLLGACAPTGPLTPLVIGWERYFKLEWQADTRNGRPVVAGYILNDGDFAAIHIRLLVDSIGPGGELLGQQLVFVDALTPGTRAYFEAPPTPPAPAYRVRVFSFEWLMGEISMGPRLPP